MTTLMLLLAANPPLKEILIGFLVVIVVIAVIAGLIYAIESWIIKGPIPGPIKLVIGLILNCACGYLGNSNVRSVARVA